MAISPETHLAWILEQVTPVQTERLPLAAALGRVLAEPAHAAHALPLWPNSAMDGYALRAADTAGARAASPAKLTVLGEVAAGSAWDPPLAAGECVRIMTGAPLPSSADAVARVEATVGDRAAEGDQTSDPDRAARAWADREVQVIAQIEPGTDVRSAGEDLAVGDLVAEAGAAVTASRASAIAAAGVAQVRVYRAPRVAVLVTGAELRPVGSRLERGQIVESNSLLVGGLLAELGLTDVHIEHCVDDVAAVRSRLQDLGARYDAIISTGGVGPGTRDVMRIALENEPGVRAVRVAVRPGQPQCTGRIEAGAMVFALPGNPVSAAVSFELFVRPALRAMQGAADTSRQRLTAFAAVGWRGAAGRLQVLPVRFVDVGAAGNTGEPGESDETGAALWCAPVVHAKRVSHSVGGFGAAEGYALVGPETGDVTRGDRVTVVRITP